MNLYLRKYDGTFNHSRVNRNQIDDSISYRISIYGDSRDDDRSYRHNQFHESITILEKNYTYLLVTAEFAAPVIKLNNTLYYLPFDEIFEELQSCYINNLSSMKSQLKSQYETFIQNCIYNIDTNISSNQQNNISLVALFGHQTYTISCYQLNFIIDLYKYYKFYHAYNTSNVLDLSELSIRVLSSSFFNVITDHHHENKKRYLSDEITYDTQLIKQLKLTKENYLLLSDEDKIKYRIFMQFINNCYSPILFYDELSRKTYCYQSDVNGNIDITETSVDLNSLFHAYKLGYQTNTFTLNL